MHCSRIAAHFSWNALGEALRIFLLAGVLGRGRRHAIVEQRGALVLVAAALEALVEIERAFVLGRGCRLLTLVEDLRTHLGGVGL